METSEGNKLYILYALNVEYRQSTDAVLSQGASLYFSDMEKVEEMLKSYRHRYACFYDPEVSDTQLYCLIVDEYEMNVIYPKKLSCRVYSPEGLMKSRMSVCEDEQAYGRVLPSPDFKEGDVVEAPIGDYLQTAIVLACPVSKEENYYTLLVYPDMEVEYVYAPLLFKPSVGPDDAVVQCLQQASAQWTNKK